MLHLISRLNITGWHQNTVYNLAGTTHHVINWHFGIPRADVEDVQGSGTRTISNHRLMPTESYEELYLALMDWQTCPLPFAVALYY